MRNLLPTVVALIGMGVPAHLGQTKPAASPLSEESKQTTEAPTSHPLVGVWRVVQWCDRDPAGGFTERFGQKPIGFFVYTPTGQLSIQVMRTPAPSPFAAGDNSPTDEERRTLLDGYFGYFGTYTIDAANSSVVHHVEGGTIPSYIGTDQHRRFRITGDTLSIGGEPLPCRVLHRVR